MDFIKLFIFQLFILTCQALCNYPPELQNKVWNDQTKGTLTYNVSTMVGWSYYLFGNTVVEWECQFNNSEFVASRSKDVYTMFGSYYRAYLCQKFHMSTNTAYYYLISDKVGDGERVYITNEVPDTICDVCSPTGPGPNDTEYHIMSGQNNAVSIVPSVGCNSCLKQCDQPGTPKITTTKMDADNHTPIYEKGPDGSNKNDEVKIKYSSPAKLIGGLIGACVGIALVAAILFWMTRRGLCVTNILDSFYEEKKINPF